jgi:hypothetical protein
LEGSTPFFIPFFKISSFSKIRHDNDKIFKNGSSKKAVANFYLSSGTNIGISNVHETIPLSS